MQDIIPLRIPGRRHPLWFAWTAILLAACGSVSPRRNPVGELFPAVTGESLDGPEVELPRDLGGEPAILLVGYVMEAQFDIDRWLVGLQQLGTPVRLYEVPTIEGMVPGMIAGTIDEGMRSGIPPEDWASVVTLYGDDAERIVALTGDDGARNARVLLIDDAGRIVWFADRGWSARLITELDRTTRELLGEATKTTHSESLFTVNHELLFDFRDPQAAGRFSAVDDRVMGGVSRSTLRAGVTAAAFEGTLSTDRGGGFASVRSAPAPVDLSGREGISLHVRGDGRSYRLRLLTDSDFDGIGYQTTFATTAGVWTTIHLPFEAFQPTFRGRVLTDVAPLDPATVKSFGLLVGDGQVGEFRVEIAWIGTFGEGSP